MIGNFQNKFYAKLESSEKELRSTQQELREVQSRLKQFEGITQNATEEANRVKSAFTIKEKQFNVNHERTILINGQNEIRKREREFEKLREQLQSCLREPASIINSSRAENVFDISAVRASLSIVSGEDSDGEGGTNDGDVTLDRLELLEHENANMRQLLASVNQILGEMRHITTSGGEMQDVHDHDSSEQISSLPVAWVYEQVKDEIETSLASISDYLRAH